MLIRQIWTLTKKDLLLVARRNWLATLLRAFVLPVVVVLIVSNVRIWTQTPGYYGVGDASVVMPLSDALRIGSERSKFVIIDHGLTGNDVKEAISQLSAEVEAARKQLVILRDPDDLITTCPMSHRGTTDCFAAVEFQSSPDQGSNASWKYTLHYDDVFGRKFDARTTHNPTQIYVLPVQHAIDSMIARSLGGNSLPDDVYHYGYTPYNEAKKDTYDIERFGNYLVGTFLAIAFLVGLVGITYHFTGHVASQREQGLLQLIDVMMPNSHRWKCVVARIVATHLAFDLIYLPGWLVMGIIAGLVGFPVVGLWYVLAYVLTGLALCSFSVLASSFFRREQLSAIATSIIVLVFAVISQFVVHLGGATPKVRSVWTLSVLCPASAFIHLTLDWAIFKEYFSITSTPAGTDSPMTGANFFGVLVFQIILFPILGGFVERHLYGNTFSSHISRSKDAMNGNSVRITGLHKQYATSLLHRTRTTAIEDLTLNLRTGSITTLLGANGSGKSTILNAVAGIDSSTHGTIEIDGALSIGLCPQNNVLWNELTVKEHVNLFEALKRPFSTQAQRQEEVHRTVENCDLGLKRDGLAKALSGGQKRKLQLAMALSGGSCICCVDEASSGIDPLARRKIWDTLLNERSDRTILLTSHFLDEVEVLSDHVALLSKGRLRLEGSVASLKASMGGGYHVMLPTGVNPPRLRDIPPGIDSTKECGATIFDAPDASSLTALLEVLDRLNVSSYQLRGPTMEDVFLRVSEEMNAKDHELQGFASYDESSNTNTSTVADWSSCDGRPAAINLESGKQCGFAAQVRNLVWKRVMILKHNPGPYLAALCLPIVTVGCASRFLGESIYLSGLPCRPSEPVSPKNWYFLTQSWIVNFGIFGPRRQALRDQMQRLIPDDGPGSFYYSAGVRWNSATFVDTIDAFDTHIQRGILDGYSFFAQGGFFVGDRPTFAFLGLDSTTGAFMQGGLNRVLSNQSWETILQPFERPLGPYELWQALTAIFTMLGLAAYPGLFALYPTAERLREVRTMQYGNGVTPSALWSAYAMFDFIFVLIVCIFAVAIWSTQYAGWYALGYVFLVALLYSIAAMVCSYLVSLFAKSQVAAVACTSLAQILITMLFFVGYVVTINRGPATEIEAWFDYIYYGIAAICPAVSLFRALLITLNVYSLACNGYTRARHPSHISLFGGPILYLLLQIVIMSALLMFLEGIYSVKIPWIKRNAGDSIIEEMWSDDDYSVVGEDDSHLSTSNDGVRVHNLTKSFGPVHAVENLSLGVLPSEKVALLGPNGAGKTSTISLIRGELQPDSTDPPAEVYISGESLMEVPEAAKSHLGVCLQADAIDTMTLSEHLHFYARARGVPNRQANVGSLIAALGLTADAGKVGSKLSGGTQRKLLLAIALIANPTVLLLDEPSRGMDAVSKRTFWNVLNTVSVDRSMLLTTHSMEEAATLCDRAAIMSGCMLALGTISDLCARHGDRLHVHIVHEDAPHSADADVDIIWRWVKSTFTITQADQRTYGGQLRFSVPRQDQSHVYGRMAGGKQMGHLFRAIEANKAALGIRDYSISPTTLDQVFLNVVSKHNVVEENTLPIKKKKWATPRLFRRKELV